MTTRFAAVAGAWLCAACSTIQPVTRPRQFIADKRPEIMWVTNEWREVIPVAYPQIAGDSVLGMWIGMNERLRIPLVTVRNFEARQFDETRTVLLTAGVTFAVASLLLFRFSSEGGSPEP